MAKFFCGSSSASDGTTRVRFIEPGQVATPPDQAANPAAKLGILTDPDDVETVLAYYVDGQAIDADQIQHRKANVDANVRRGFAAVFSGAQESPPRRKTAAQYERRRRNPIGHRADPQASSQQPRRASSNSSPPAPM